MHEALQKFFQKHQAKTCQCKQSVHAQLVAIHDASDEVDQHIRDLQSQLTRAELEAHDHAIDGKLEWMHTRLNAAAERAAAFRKAGRDLAKVLVEVESAFQQDHLELTMAMQSESPSRAESVVASE